MATRPAAKAISGLDPYKFMATIGKAVPYLGYIVVSATKPA